MANKKTFEESIKELEEIVEKLEKEYEQINLSWNEELEENMK